MNNQKTAVILAGTIPHITLIQKLKERGYRTVLVDYNPNCPAREHADKYINESTLDYDAVLNIAKNERADLVISIVGDHINAVCCYVAEQLGLPHPYSYQDALAASRKSRMKPLFKEYGIPTADYYILHKNDKREIRMDFPLVVKPSDANSSKGVFRVDNEKAFYEKIELSFAESREGAVVVEKYIEGMEIQVDCIAIHGKAYICMMKDTPAWDDGGAHELQFSGFYVPGKACTANAEQILEVAQKIADAYHLDSGAFFYQGKCNEHGVYVLEAAARMAGGTTFESTALCCDCDYMEMAVDGFLGNEIQTVPQINDRKFVGKFLHMKPGVFESVTGVDELLEQNMLVCAWIFVNPGTVISEKHIGSNRIGCIMADCCDYEAGAEKISQALEAIRILDKDGNDMSEWR